MKDNAAYIAVVLDRSGSMGAVKNATIDGFNEFLSKQKATPGECHLFLAQFDDIYEIVCDKPLAEVEPLNDNSYQPRGMTALHDAIGKTINSLGEKLKTFPEAERPGRIVVAIITDGQENASKEFRQAKIAEMVEYQTKAYSWNFVFIGANQDAVLTAKQLSIPAGSTVNYSGTAAGGSNALRALASNTSAYRQGSVNDPSCLDFSQAQATASMAT